MSQEKRRFIAFSVIIGLFVVIVAVMIFLALRQSENESGRITIQNYGDYVKNLSPDERKSIEKTLFDTVSLNNVSSDKIATINDALIRGESYTQTIDSGIYTTHFIVDMDSIQQSYKIEDIFSNSPPEVSGLIDYTALALCVAKDAMKYPDFNCKDRISNERGLEKSDPVLEYLPVSTRSYTLSADPNSPELSLEMRLFLTSSDYERGKDAVREQYEAELREWFSSKGLDMNNYSITYTYS